MEWLSEEEQYKEGLTREQIRRIKDEELREIRYKYCERMLRNFNDEKNISDKELIRIWEEDKEKERKEIEEYRKRKASD